MYCKHNSQPVFLYRLIIINTFASQFVPHQSWWKGRWRDLRADKDISILTTTMPFNLVSSFTLLDSSPRFPVTFWGGREWKTGGEDAMNLEKELRKGHSLIGCHVVSPWRWKAAGTGWQAKTHSIVTATLTLVTMLIWIEREKKL